MNATFKCYVVMDTGFAIFDGPLVASLNQQLATGVGLCKCSVLLAQFCPSLAAFIPNLGVGKPHPVGSTLTLVGSLNLTNCEYLQLYQGSSGVPDFRYLAGLCAMPRHLTKRDPTSLVHRIQ